MQDKIDLIIRILQHTEGLGEDECNELVTALIDIQRKLGQLRIENSNLLMLNKTDPVDKTTYQLSPEEIYLIANRELPEEDFWADGENNANEALKNLVTLAEKGDISRITYDYYWKEYGHMYGTISKKES